MEDWCSRCFVNEEETLLSSCLLLRRGVGGARVCVCGRRSLHKCVRGSRVNSYVVTFSTFSKRTSTDHANAMDGRGNRKPFLFG